jgi:hypothetical protein
VKPAEVNGSEKWPMTETNIKTMNTCERNILRRNIYEPVVEQKNMENKKKSGTAGAI